MQFSAEREALLTALQSIIGVIERRQTMPVLANVLLVGSDNNLALTASDTEVELVARIPVELAESGEITVPGRKLLEIVRTLPEGAKITLNSDGDKATVRSGKSRFTLAILPASDFPTLEDIKVQQDIRLPQQELKKLIDRTYFAMAQQDVRYYLNGMLIEMDNKALRAVATDGHRLAMAQADVAGAVSTSLQVIVPRKAILELQRLISGDGDVEIWIGQNHIRIQFGHIRFTSKLIDGRFPDYTRVVPSRPSKLIEVDREILKAALQRTAILSNEKFRGIRLWVKPGSLVLQAHNPEQEEAEEEIDLNYTGEAIEIGFNVNYLLDALAAIDGSVVELGLSDSNSSCLLRQPGSEHCKYVVMPMRL